MDNEAIMDSKVKWIGAVPLDWKQYRIKDVSELSPTYSGDKPGSETLCTVIPMECVSEKGEVDTSNLALYENIQNGLTLFEKGDVIFAKITPCMENGKGAYIENLPTKYAFGSTEFHVLRTGFKVIGKFLYYYTFYDGFRNYAAVNMTGAAGQKRVSSNFLKYTPIYLPDVLEQQAIVEYLNQRCAKLDAIIGIKQQQIQTINALRQSIIYQAVTKGLDTNAPLVDSGVEWLGKIRQGWRVVRVKDILDFYNTERIPLSAAERGEMEIKKYDYYGASGVIDKVDNYIFDGTYILVAEDGANLISRNTPLAFIAKGKFWVNNHAHILKPRHGNITYFTNLLESMDFSLFVTGAAQPKLTKDNLGNFKILNPPLYEQERIAEFIDKETQRLDQLKTNLSQQIATLEAYKKSLIYECVTGKKRIVTNDEKADALLAC